MLPSRVFFRAAALATACLSLFASVSDADEVVRIMAANTSSGNNQSYDPGHGNRIFQGLDPDIALVQETNVTLNGSKNSAATYRQWVNENFGTTFYYHVEPTTSGGDIPNCIVSRYPFLATGVWDDAEQSNRDFVWARIDLPGDMNLLAVSVHLSSSAGSTSRNAQATALRSLIQANKLATDHVVIGGDFNTDNRTEACLSTLSSVVVTASPWPADQHGVQGTNASRAKPYDWVAPSSSLAALSTPLVIGSSTFTNGLVFDSNDYSPLSAVAPVLSGDSSATNMQHMAVMRAFLIPTNDPPVIAQGTSVANTLSKNNTPTAFSRSLSATDPEGNPLTWSIMTAAAHGTAGIVAPATGGTVNLSYQPVTNYTGTDSFVVRVSDGLGGTDTITVNLTIQEPPNNAPVITEGTNVAVTLSKNNTPLAFSRTLAATDADGDPLTWAISTAAGHGTAGVVTPATGGSVSLSYQPAANYTGTDSFVVRVSDGKTGTDTITVNLTIQEPPNTPPVITDGTSVAVTLSKNNTPTAFSRSLAATDANGDPLTWSISTAAANGTAGVVAPATGGTVSLSYQPAANYVGTDSFVVTVADGKGGTDTITVNLTIQQPPNSPPVIQEGAAVEVTLTSTDGAPLSHSQLVNGSDVDDDILTWTILQQPAHGVADVAGGGSALVSYSPNLHYSGPDSLVVQVADGRGGTDAITFNFTIGGVRNIAPVIGGPATVSKTYTEESNPPLGFAETFLATDADSDAMTWSVESPPTHGQLNLEVLSQGGQNSSVSAHYAPEQGFFGTDTFTVKVGDGFGGLDTVSFSVTVQGPPNNAPVILQGDDIWEDVAENAGEAILQPLLTAQDENPASLVWSISTLPAHGTARVEASGANCAMVYEPTPGFHGIDQFFVKLTDNFGATDEAMVTVFVGEIPEYDSWVFQMFGRLDPATEATIWGEDADPDGDGFTNLEEFAHGGYDPNTPSWAPPLMSQELAADAVLLTYRIRVKEGVPELDYTVQATDDLITPWTELLPADYTLISETQVGGGMLERKIRISIEPGGPKFFRLRFERL